MSGRARRAWSLENPGNRAIREEAAATLLALVDVRGADVLDAGCGTGWWLERVAAAGAASVRGVELDPARVAAARARGFAVDEGDVRALPYEAARFDAVFLLTVLSSVTRWHAAVAECLRVLAPGGALAIWEPRVPNPLNPDTHLVTARGLRAVAGEPAARRTLTVLPALARGLRGRGYARLARVPLLRTHTVTVFRPR